MLVSPLLSILHFPGVGGMEEWSTCSWSRSEVSPEDVCGLEAGKWKLVLINPYSLYLLTYSVPDI